MSMNNYGLPVPGSRRSAGEAAIKQMLPDVNAEDRGALLGQFVEAVERDQSAALFAPDAPSPIGLLDITGRYRLLATVLA